MTFRNHNWCNYNSRKKLHRLKIQSIIVLSLFVVYSHSVWALERFHEKSISLGIYPRGGARERGFTDVIHISPPGIRPTRKDPNTTIPHHNTIIMQEKQDRNDLSAKSYRMSSTTTDRQNAYSAIRQRSSLSSTLDSSNSHVDGSDWTNRSEGRSRIWNHSMRNSLSRTASTSSFPSSARANHVVIENPSRLSDPLNKGQYVLMRNDSSSSSIPSSFKKPSQMSSKNTEPSSMTGRPLIYRYFARSRTRTGSDSIPFIILGPSVDHWKICGKILAARGFNVMAVERVKNRSPINTSLATTPSNSKNTPPSSSLAPEIRLDEDGRPIHEGEALISAVLDALKWPRAVLVGCDEESILLIEAAIRMAPDRVAGLVLCGDLQSVEKHIETQIQNMKNQGVHEEDYNMNLDSFLVDFLDCPTSIIWGGNYGDDRIIREPEVDTMRSVIIGGGLAPHRRLPEQFAWTLSRFVENKVSPHAVAYDIGQRKGEDGAYNHVSDTEQPQESRLRRAINYTRYHSVWKDILPESVTKAFDEIFAPGSLLVTGRIIAFAIMYMSLARVSLFQYRNLKDIPTTILSAKNILKLLVSVPGSIFRRRRQLTQDGPVTDSGGNFLFQDEIDENEKLKEKIVEAIVPDMEDEDVDKNENIHPEETQPLEDFIGEKEQEIHVDSHEDDEDSDQGLKHFFFDQIVS